MLMAVVLLVSLFFFIILGVPILYSLGAASLIGRLIQEQALPYFVFAQKITYGLDNFNWVAIPLFLLLGQLMNSIGATDKIFGFAQKLVGHVRGGLAHVNVLASMIFAGMSGSASADAAGLGKIEIKAMTNAGYGLLYSSAVTAASACLGPILPPSIPAIVYATIAGTSVIKIFLAAVVPAIVMMSIMLFMCTYYAKKYNYPKNERAKIPEIISAGREAFLSLLLPILMIIGMYSGIFTASEVGAVGCGYALILAFLYRKSSKNLTIKSLMSDISIAAVDSGIILMIIAMVGVYGWILTRYRIPVQIFEWVISFTSSPLIILILINIILLIIGMLMPASPALLILVPLLLPIIDGLGIDRTVFGVATILNLTMGGITPPVGNMLVILTRVAGVKYEELALELVPWYIPFFITIVSLYLFPGIALWLPKLLGFN